MSNLDIVNRDKEYKTGNTIVYSCQYHVIFCPKYRRPVLINGVDKRLKELIVERQKEYGYEVLAVEVMPDHVHLLLDVDPREGVNVVVGKIKGYTATTLRNEFPELKTKLPSLWTRSRFISSVGSVSLETVKQYIGDQKNK